MEGLGGINEDYPDIPTPSEEERSDVLSIDTSGKSGHEAVLDLLERQEDASVTYIALGPLTNLALAIRTNADLFRRKVAVVSIMGGALDVPGNTTPVAEFNVYAVSSHECFVIAQLIGYYRTLLQLSRCSRQLLRYRNISLRWISRPVTL